MGLAGWQRAPCENHDRSLGGERTGPRRTMLGGIRGISVLITSQVRVLALPWISCRVHTEALRHCRNEGFRSPDTWWRQHQHLCHVYFCANVHRSEKAPVNFVLSLQEELTDPTVLPLHHHFSLACWSHLQQAVCEGLKAFLGKVVWYYARVQRLTLPLLVRLHILNVAPCTQSNTAGGDVHRVPPVHAKKTKTAVSSTGLHLFIFSAVQCVSAP